MKTPMNIYNTAMKKKKNRKGFSLVELIVVLVIMAILAAALVPTLIGYIKQTRQSNAKNEASACVSAAQTIASSAFADPSGKYSCVGTSNVVITFTSATPDDDSKLIAEVEYLAEVDGTVSNITFDPNYKVTRLTYVTADSNTTVTYDGTTYTAK